MNHHHKVPDTFQARDERYPNLKVEYDPDDVRLNAVHEVFLALKALDMDNAEANIFEPKHLDSNRNSPPKIIFEVSDDIRLRITISPIGIGITIDFDPAKFDRTNPGQEEVLQRCARLVTAIHESPVKERDERQPAFERFEFWKWNEANEDGKASARWKKLAKIWTTASEPLS